MRLLSFFPFISSPFIRPSSQLLGIRSLYHLLKAIHRPTQTSLQLFLHRVLLLPDGVGVGCDVQTANTFSLFSSQDKEDGSLRKPARAVLLFRLPLPICISGFECNGEAGSTIMPQNAALIALLLVPHACPSSAGIPCRSLTSSRAGRPIFLFSSLTSTTRILNLVSHGMKEKYLHRSTNKSTHFDKHSLTNLIKKFDLHLHFPIL